MMDIRRNEALDLAKGIGIILVVLGHSFNVNSLFGMFIYSFHMPLFFIISGMCFCYERNLDFVMFLKKRVRQLLLPTASFTVLSIFLMSFAGMTDEILMNLRWNGLPGALWFLPILFLTEMVYWIVYKFVLVGRKDVIRYQVLIILICLMLAMTTTHFKLCAPYCVFVIFAAMAYYSFGNMIKFVFQDKLKAMNSKSIICLTSFFLCILIILTRKHSMLMYSNDIVLTDIIASMGGCVGTLVMSELIIENKAIWHLKQTFLWLGNNTLCIMGGNL